MKQYKQEITNAILAGLSLVSLYIFIMLIATRSIDATVSQLQQLWYWMLLLITGFSIQIGLYTHMRKMMRMKHEHGVSRGVVGTSASTSAIGMIACCAHHLTEVLPIIGLSGAAVFLTQFQVPLILLGVAMNVIGTIYILRIIKKIS